jgi:hypothetical protein
MFGRGSRDARRLVTLVEELLDRNQISEAGTVDELLNRYGRETPDNRGVGGPALRAAIKYARDENRWTEAVPVFLDEATRQADHDTPYVWLVSFLDREGRTRSAIDVAKNAAMQCRMKHSLLRQAAELALFSGAIRESVHLFSQSIAVAGRAPRFGEPALERSFLFMAELFDLFGDSAGRYWADQFDFETELEGDYVAKIHRAARRVTSEERALIKAELPEIRKALEKQISVK